MLHETAVESEPPSRVKVFIVSLSRQLQALLDQSTPHVTARWIGAFTLLIFYLLRVFILEGWYIVTYGLGLYLLNLLIGFLTPQVDPENSIDDADGEPSLPTRKDDEFRPFVRRLPEFKAWWSTVKAVLFAFFLTFFEAVNIPVFWPILLIYFLALFVMTMKKQILHMIKHRYIPFSVGKKTYGK